MHTYKTLSIQYLPTTSCSLTEADFLQRHQMSSVKMVLLLLKTEVMELISALSITASRMPRVPANTQYHTGEPLLRDHLFCNRKVAFQQGWLAARVKINTFIFRLTNSLSREVSLSSGLPLRRGSIVHQIYTIGVYSHWCIHLMCIAPAFHASSTLLYMPNTYRIGILLFPFIRNDFNQN